MWMPEQKNEEGHFISVNKEILLAVYHDDMHFQFNYMFGISQNKKSKMYALQ